VAPAPVVREKVRERAESTFSASVSSKFDEPMVPAEMAAEIEAELTAWDDIDPTATEPRSFEPQEALDFMDETAEEFDEESSGELSGESAAAPGDSQSEEQGERRGRRRRRRGRGRSRDGAESN
jgi:hypothetical protein